MSAGGVGFPDCSIQIMLLSELHRAMGPAIIKCSARSQEYDLRTVALSYGVVVKGPSLGACLLLAIVQAMTECTFHEQVTVRAGSITRMLPCSQNSSLSEAVIRFMLLHSSVRRARCR